MLSYLLPSLSFAIVDDPKYWPALAGILLIIYVTHRLYNSIRFVLKNLFACMVVLFAMAVAAIGLRHLYLFLASVVVPAKDSAMTMFDSLTSPLNFAIFLTYLFYGITGMAVISSFYLLRQFRLADQSVVVN